MLNRNDLIARYTVNGETNWTEYRNAVHTYRAAIDTLEQITSAHIADRKTPAETVSEWVSAVGYDVATVALASWINSVGDWDARVSLSNRRWAVCVTESFDGSSAIDLRIYSDRIHRVHLDQLADAFRAYVPEAPKPTEPETVEPSPADQYPAAAQTYPELMEEVIADNVRRADDLSVYVNNGWFPSWSEMSRRRADHDGGIKRYSTPAKWSAYQAGEITREKAASLALRRALRENDKTTRTNLEKLEQVAKAAPLDWASVRVEWVRSATWGYNPHAALHTFGNATTGRASGCGYDKGSTAIAEALNKNPSALRVLFDLAEAALKRGESAKSATSCTGHHWGECVGYGAGYSVLPSWEGGVGASCFWSIFRKAGYTVREDRSGKHWDYYGIEKTA